MIIFENTEVVGWKAAIRGMQNPIKCTLIQNFRR